MRYGVPWHYIHTIHIPHRRMTFTPRVKGDGFWLRAFRTHQSVCLLTLSLSLLTTDHRGGRPASASPSASASAYRVIRTANASPGIDPSILPFNPSILDPSINVTRKDGKPSTRVQGIRRPRGRFILIGRSLLYSPPCSHYHFFVIYHKLPLPLAFLNPHPSFLHWYLVVYHQSS